MRDAARREDRRSNLRPVNSRRYDADKAPALL